MIMIIPVLKHCQVLSFFKPTQVFQGFIYTEILIILVHVLFLVADFLRWILYSGGSKSSILKEKEVQAFVLDHAPPMDSPQKFLGTLLRRTPQFVSIMNVKCTSQKASYKGEWKIGVGGWRDGIIPRSYLFTFVKCCKLKKKKKKIPP